MTREGLSKKSTSPCATRSIDFLSMSNKLIDHPKAMIPLVRWVSAVRVPVYDAAQRAAVDLHPKLTFSDALPRRESDYRAYIEKQAAVVSERSELITRWWEQSNKGSPSANQPQ